MTRTLRIAFLAGMFPEKQKEFIHTHSSGVIQNAADAYQKNVIAGLAAQSDVHAVVVNLPFVHAWPSSFRKAWFPPISDTERGLPIEGVGFANLSLIRYFSRMASAFFGLRRGNASRADTVLVYSAHVPFMIAAILEGRVFGRRQLAIIVLDLPEFMGEMGIANKLFGSINRRLFYWLIKFFDKIVVLTEAMIPRLGVAHNKAIVVEGIATIRDCKLPRISNPATSVFLYTGTLAMRYGIKDLIDGFSLVSNSEARLWICGEGEAAGLVIAAQKSDPRIRFFGQVDRTQVLTLQENVDFLINPRGLDGEFVHYSFPSKVMEYLGSGRPVIMYPLPGIPGEYDGYFLPIRSPGGVGIASAMNEALSMTDEERSRLACAAETFVRVKKNPREQVRRIIEFIRGDNNRAEKT